MKEIFRYNRRLATAALILVIVVTIFADTNFALISDKKDVTNAYKDDSLSSSVLKCADEAALMYSAVENSGGKVADKAKERLDTLRKRASSPTGLEDTLSDVYTDVIAVYEQNPNDKTVKKHFDSVGDVLDALASSSDYNEASAEYNETRSGLLCRLIAPWFGKAADFSSLYDRYRTNFDLPSEPPSSDDGSLGDWIADHWFLTLVILLGIGVVAKVEKK